LSKNGIEYFEYSNNPDDTYLMCAFT
jgi:hypothetical protein